MSQFRAKGSAGERTPLDIGRRALLSLGDSAGKGQNGRGIRRLISCVQRVPVDEVHLAQFSRQGTARQPAWPRNRARQAKKAAPLSGRGSHRYRGCVESSVLAYVPFCYYLSVRAAALPLAKKAANPVGGSLFLALRFVPAATAA
jgi:hypothetical protein